MKTYIGDSIYAEVVHDQLKLTTENGEGPTNTIYFDPEIWDSLVIWVRSLNKEREHFDQ